jgi:hypothetical protein
MTYIVESSSIDLFLHSRKRAVRPSRGITCNANGDSSSWRRRRRGSPLEGLTVEIDSYLVTMIFTRRRGGTCDYQPMYWVFSGIRSFEYFIESTRLVYSIFTENLEVIVRHIARAGQAFMNDFQQAG